MQRLVVIAMLLASVACSSTERLHDGTKLPSELAVVSVDESALPLQFTLFNAVGGRILRVDGRKLRADRVELLPGRHDLCVEFSQPLGFTQQGRVAFDAEAGKQYALRLQLHRERGQLIVLTDAETGAVIADTYVLPTDANPVSLDLSGEGWYAAGGAEACMQRTITWLKSGETLKDWTEMVEVVETRFDAGIVPDIDAALENREDELDSATVIGDEWEVLSRGPRSGSYRYSGKLLGSAERRAGVGHFAIDGQRLLLFIYELRSDEAMPTMGLAVRDQWLARFAQL